MSMLSNLTVRTKLFGGFGLLTAILVTLGAIGCVMFGRVDSNVTRLADHSLAAVKNSTGVERAAFEAILAEKNYLLYKSDLIHQAARKKLGELACSLDAVDKIAERFADADLAKKSKDVRDLATQFGKLYDQGVAAVKDNKIGEDTMDARGTLVGNEANAYLASKKTEYLEAKNALAIVNRINELALETRMNEKAYMLAKEQKYFDTIRKNIDELHKCYDHLEKLHPDAGEQKQISDARGATADYLDTAKKWVAEHRKDPNSTELAELAKTMDRYGEIVGRNANEYLKAKEAKANKVAQAVFIVADIANEASTTRLNEKGYLLTQDQKYWTGLTEHITTLGRLYGELSKVSLTQEDLQRIERADKATQEYLAAAKSWVENDARLRTAILPEMKKSGETVIATAQAAENDAWESSGKAATSVADIVSRSKAIIAAAMLAGVLLGCFAAWSITRGITGPLFYVVQHLQSLAEGNLKSRVQEEYLRRKDEIGELARSLAKTIESLCAMIAGIATNAKGLSAASTQLSATATQLASGAEQTTNQSAQVAAAAEQMSTNMSGMAASTAQMSGNVKMVAAAVEELTASIGEVAASAERAAGVANNAAQLVSASNVQITGLGDAAQQIGKVIEVIQDIAEQTSLLALNATIEAARAGDAGKGFAVVATEVKELARQTASATEDIRKRIEAIQGSSGQAVKSVGDISEIIAQVNELSRTIASAVEEQSITTKEIAKNVAESSKAADDVARGVTESAEASKEISKTIVGVDQAAKQAAQGATETQSAGTALSDMAEQFQELVAQFKV
jgi:methyl-accepting chemotaxis protein